MKLVLKGDLELLGNFKVVQAMHATFQNALNALNKIDSANFLSDEIKKWIINNAKKSKDIKTIRRINESTAQPLGNSGANIYTKSLRYDITAYNK